MEKKECSISGNESFPTKENEISTQNVLTNAKVPNLFGKNNAIKKSKLTNSIYKIQDISEVDKLRLEILKIRKQKELIEMDILVLKKKEKEIDMHVKEINLMKLL